MKSAPHFLLSASVCLLLAVAASGCLTTKAATVKKEPLVVPPAPPRVIAPIPEPDDQVVTSSEPEPVPQLPRQTRTAPRENPPRAEPKPPQQGAPGPTETEAKPAAAPPPAPTPGPELRTIDSQDPALATRKVRDTMERAGRTLGQIDYGKLPKPSQLQYDMAKRFIEQSEEALKAKNFTAAQLMAEKAETIAKELSGR